MKKRAVSGIIFTLLLVGMLTLTFNISSVKATDGTDLYIYIRADGRIDPSDAPIGTTDNITYRIYGDIINRSIIVERDNITLQGDDYIVVKGNESLRVGIDLTGRKNVTVENVRVTKFNYGVVLNSSTDCRLLSSTIWENWAGVWIENCLRAEIRFSNISYNNNYGIRIYSSGNNELISNIIWRNYDGISMWYSVGDAVLDNNVSLNFGTGILLYYSMGGTWLASNNVSSNGYFGISIRDSSDVTMTNNKASNNQYNFGVDGISYRDFTTHTIGTTNTVDGKPIYYIKNVSDSIYDADTNAGTIYLINCKNVTVRNLNLTDNECGIFLWNTTQSSIENVSVSGNVYGVRLEKSSDNTITLNNMTHNQYGIWINDCNETKIIQNDVATNQFGLFINSSMLNNISRNSISENTAYGIHLDYSSNNTITQNIVAENGEEVFPEPLFFGIELYNSENNTVYHNNFINNYGQAYAISSNNNKWDNGLPSGGNYWSDYAGNDIDNDGIGSPPYEIDAQNIDMYPLMGMFHSFNTSLGYCVDVISNSTIEDFRYFESNSTIRMQVSNTTAIQTHGFCRLTIPHNLLAPPYNVTVNGVLTPYTTVFENETLSIIYFSYEHSELEIIITPEFASSMMLLTSLIFVMVPLIFAKKTRYKKAKA